MIARHITDADLDLYQRHGWHCVPLYMRGDDLTCFLATFRCAGR